MSSQSAGMQLMAFVSSTNNMQFDTYNSLHMHHPN